MNSPFSLAALKSSPALPPAAELVVGLRTKPASDAFGQMLQSAVARPPERHVAPGKVDRTESRPGNSSEDQSEFTERTSRARGRTKNNRTEPDDRLAGACAVSPQSAPPDNTLKPQAAAGEDLTVDANGTAATPDRGAESELTSPGEDGSKIASGKVLTATTGTLTEMLTPAPSEPAQVEPPPELTPTSTTSLEALPAESEPAASRAEVVSADAAAPMSPTQSALQIELQSPEGQESSADDASTSEVLPDSAQTVSPEPDDVRRTARAARRAWVESLESPRGIATAQSRLAMNSTTNLDVSAGRTEQFLPGTLPSSGSNLPPLPGLPAESRGGVPAPGAEDIAAAKLSPVSPAPVRAGGAEANAVEARPLAPMGRISDIISREVRLFKRAADDLVEVVLTPDAKTQISLRLQWREGQVEAQARCDFGDFKALNLQWPQLQAALAAHGVRLSHLAERVQSGFTDFFNNPSFGSGGSGLGSRGDSSPQTPDPKPETVNRPANLPAVRKFNRANPLLESWA